MKIIIIIAVIVAIFYMAQYLISGKSSVNAQENIKAGDEFLASNAKNDGVVTLPSGLQYLILSAGTGTAHPSAKSKVTVHYHGTLLDGTVFDSSVDRNEPITFPLNRVIKGWSEGVQLMVEGDKMRFFIPSKLAYGNQSMGSIQSGSTLIFDVELLIINK